MCPDILIVDDEPSARRTLQAILLKQNYTLHFAASGPEALITLQDITPDVILLDVMMPGMNGIDLCRQIKSDEQWRHIPVILVTALDSKTDVVRGLEAGADDFLAKPVDVSELRARIRSMLRIKTQYDQLTTQKEQLAAAFELNQRSAQVIAQHLETLEVIHDMGLRLIKDLNTDSVLNLISQTALEIVPEAVGSVMHFIPNDETALLPVIYSAQSKSKLVQSSVGFEEIAKQALKTNEAINIGDVSRHPWQHNVDLREMRSLLIVPLASNMASLGTVTLYSPQADVFSESHAYLMSILANQTAVALDRTCMLEQESRRHGREKHHLKDVFQRYISPLVVDHLIKAQEPPMLGGQKQEATILFADIRGFTSFSETTEPEQLVEVLNRYLALAVEAIAAQSGTLDKFIGDALMAIFNAPLPQPNHTRKAVQAALEMQQAIAAYNLQNPTHPQLSFGIGIHVGPAVVGNVGTNQRMNYTAMGDTVNLAWRLQEKARKGEIILSRAAYAAVENVALVEDLGSIKVKGRRTVEPIYALTGLVEDNGILPNPIIRELEKLN